MKSFLFFALLLSTFLTTGHAWACHVDPKAAWSLSGFENPESAYFDSATHTIYVSNVSGDPQKKDGKGFISTVSPEGTLKELHWMDGFDAPKGIRVFKGNLYVADIGKVVVIDIAKKKILKSYDFPKSQFVNDVVVDTDGTIYATDTFANKVYSVSPKGEIKTFLTTSEGPNGILLRGDKMYLADWGMNSKPDFSTTAPGRLFEVTMKTKQMKPITATPFGHLDGLEIDSHGDWIISDWKAGKIFHVGPRGDVRELVTTTPGTADIGFISKGNVSNAETGYRMKGDLIIIPQMNDNKVVAYYLR